MCLDSNKSNNPGAKSPYYDPFAPTPRKATSEPALLKQPSPYSDGASAGPYISNQGQDMASSSPTLPTVKVFRPIAPPLPQATVTLTLTETQAKHLRELLGCIGTGDNAPVVNVWAWGANKRPAVKDLRVTTDSLYWTLTAAGV